MFDVGVEMFKFTRLWMILHNLLYSVERPSRETYVEVVDDLEKKLQKWWENLPKHISLCTNLAYSSIIC